VLHSVASKTDTLTKCLQAPKLKLQSSDLRPRPDAAAVQISSTDELHINDPVLINHKGMWSPGVVTQTTTPTPKTGENLSDNPQGIVALQEGEHVKGSAQYQHCDCLLYWQLWSELIGTRIQTWLKPSAAKSKTGSLLDLRILAVTSSCHLC